MKQRVNGAFQILFEGMDLTVTPISIEEKHAYYRVGFPNQDYVFEQVISYYNTTAWFPVTAGRAPLAFAIGELIDYKINSGK